MSASVLIIEQGFLKPRGSKPVHGVELFRLNLMAELLALGVEVTVVAEGSWRGKIEGFFEARGGAGPRGVYAGSLGGVPVAGLVGTVRAGRLGSAGRGRWDTVLYGNARLGMVPAMHWASWMNLADRHVLFAHRDPGSNFLDVVSTLRFDTVANSEWVAQWYRGQTSGRVDVCYGLADAGRFVPRMEGESRRVPGTDDGRVHMCLLGRLPNISKGQEKALAAVRALPERVRSRVVLHLAGFADPPDFGDPCVVAHRWMGAGEVAGFLRSMDVMVAVSTHETFSQAIVQGMLSGLAVIASDIPVFSEKLDPLAGGGRLDGATGAIGASGTAERRVGGILTRSVQDVTDAMTRLVEDAGLRERLGREARGVALERYVWDTRRFVERHLFPGRWGAADAGVIAAGGGAR